MRKFKLTIHPIYFGVMLYYIIIGRAWLFISYLLAVILHELAHAGAAATQGYRLGHLSLMPYGALLGGDVAMPRRVAARVAIAGPMANGLLALLTLSLWWIMPTMYDYTRYFLQANVSLIVFNLIPAYPLDGGRILLCLPCKNKLKLVKILRAVGIVFGGGITILGLVSIAYDFNITLIFSGVFLILSAVLGGGDEVYSHIASRPLAYKSYNDGVVCNNVIIADSSQLLKLLRLIRHDRVVEVTVINSDGEEVGRLTENNIADLLSHNKLSTAIRDVDITTYSSEKRKNNA